MTDARAAHLQPTHAELEELISRHGLKRAGARPPLAEYTRQLWGRRHFVMTFATANNAVGYSRSFLGQAWQLLTPLMNVSVYFLVFGLLLHTNRGIDNFIGFLVIGYFTFHYTQTSVIMGAKSVGSNLGLTRVLHFPRAVLPVSSTLVALEQLLYSLIIMIPVVLITGEPLRVRWLLLIPAFALQTMFCLGLAFAVARIAARVPDTSQVLPFVMRTWLYMSGVFYSVDRFTKGHPHWIKDALSANPAAVYLEVVRNALLTDSPIPSYDWPLAVGWAVVILAVGYVFFWQAEEQYGRV